MIWIRDDYRQVFRRADLLQKVWIDAQGAGDAHVFGSFAGEDRQVLLRRFDAGEGDFERAKAEAENAAAQLLALVAHQIDQHRREEALVINDHTASTSVEQYGMWTVATMPLERPY